MIFGRKRRAGDAPSDEVGPDEALETEAAAATLDDEAEPMDDAELDEEALAADPDGDADADWREDGPFDIDEVEVADDPVHRLDLGALILTPWEGLGLQLQINEASQQVSAALAVWDESGLQLALLAAPTSGGLAAETREDVIAEAQNAGGRAETIAGPFGPEVRRVLPVPGPNGERLYQEARIWAVEGPRWMLTGTLIGKAARSGEEAASAPFVEFFRNVIVRRGDGPLAPGELIPLTMPKGLDGSDG